MPLVYRAGGLARFHFVKHRAQLDSLTQGKLLPCSPPKKSRASARPLFFFGGGENRTLVLSKRYIDDYMLSAFFVKSALPEGAPLGTELSGLFSRTPAINRPKGRVHTKMYDGGTLEPPV